MSTKKVVGSAVTLGVGNSMMGAIPGGSVMAPAMNKTGNMLGMAATGMYAKDTMQAMAKMPEPQNMENEGKHKMPDGSYMKDKDMPGKKKPQHPMFGGW